MISQIVKNNYPFLKQLAKTRSLHKRKRLLKQATIGQLLSLSEISLNIVKNRFQLTKRQKGRLVPFADFVRRIGRVRTERGARRIVIQKGNDDKNLNERGTREILGSNVQKSIDCIIRSGITGTNKWQGVTPPGTSILEKRLRNDPYIWKSYYIIEMWCVSVCLSFYRQVAFFKCHRQILNSTVPRHCWSPAPRQSAGACAASLLEPCATSICWSPVPRQSAGALCHVNLLEPCATSICWSLATSICWSPVPRQSAGALCHVNLLEPCATSICWSLATSICWSPVPR
uniref:Transposase n=1 Tax=Meloidogyne hapla TaxID=6305 RepID=A0A1I8BQX2_MELHA